MTFQRIGPHCQGSIDADAKAWIARAPISKSVDDVAPLLLAHDNALRVFRAYVPEAEQPNITPQAFLNLTLSRLQGYSHPRLYVEGLNEYKSTLATGFADYLDWTAEFVTLAHAAGLKVAGISAPTGNLDEPEIALLIERGFCGMDVLSAHHYWAGQGFTEWNALRYRRWRQQGVTLPILITEAGRDAVDNFQYPVVAGWKAQGVELAVYQAEWLAYNAELAKDPNVYAVGFTLGDNPRWQNFEMNSSAAWFAERTEPPAEPISFAKEPEVPTMPTTNEKIEQLLAQNALITQALIDFRHGRFTGAEGMDGKIVALNGGVLPDGWNPSYPKA